MAYANTVASGGGSRRYLRCADVNANQGRENTTLPIRPQLNPEDSLARNLLYMRMFVSIRYFTKNEILDRNRG